SVEFIERSQSNGRDDRTILLLQEIIEDSPGIVASIRDDVVLSQRRLSRRRVHGVGQSLEVRFRLTGTARSHVKDSQCPVRRDVLWVQFERGFEGGLGVGLAVRGPEKIGERYPCVD